MEKKTRKKSSLIQGINYIYVGIAIFVIALIVTIIMIKPKNKPKEIYIPNFVGMNVEEAQEKAKSMDLYLNFENGNNGTVVAQNPPYNENYKIKTGATIDIEVSSTKASVVVPKVVGKTKSEAIKELERLNLKVQVVEELSKKVEKGYVLKQEPQEDEIVKENDIVKLYISIGSEN